MENFIYSIPTKIAFGKGQVERATGHGPGVWEKSPIGIWRGKH